jgi:pimeloyl-ACP methyl ester carboxylesterase
MSEEQPAVKLSYPFPRCGEGSIHLFGSRDASHLVIMCAGFPDDHKAFTPLAVRLAEECGYLVGVICLPGYGTPFDPSTFHKDGYSFADWVASLREAVKALRSHSTKPTSKTKLTGIFHDWGVIAGLQYTNQTIEEEVKDLMPSQLVIFDVLLGYHPKTTDKPKLSEKDSAIKTTYNSLRVLLYQMFLAIAFVLQKYLPKSMIIAYLSVGSLILKTIEFFPMSRQDFKYVDLQQYVRPSGLSRLAYICYPYRNMIQALFSGNVGSAFANCSLPLDLTKTPVLFLYGGGKPVSLHNPKAVALLDQEQEQGNRSRSVKVEDAGHWLHWSHLDTCFQEIQQFLKEA